ncbi:MAG: serine/threonine-protein kinase [Deltaproteobacteria bacterium]
MPPASSLPLERSAAPVGAAETAAPETFRRKDFELVSLAGRGTYAEVWQVRHLRTGKLLALKQLRSDREDQPAARRILENEAEVAGKIGSEFVVQLVHADLDAAPPCLILEWLPGKTLEARLATEQRLFCREALWIARQCAQGMHALLVAGYTHGDIKPSNIFLLDDGSVKLIDLGFARADRLPATDLADEPGPPLTGTPDYLAPEVLVSGGSGGVARDVYSLGVTLYRMLTGSLPFQGETVADVLRQHQGSLPHRLRSLAPDVPREAAEMVQRLMSKQPLRRGGGLSWLIRDLIGLELLLLAAEGGSAVRETAEADDRVA